MEDLISIVVPLYNCETYIEECLNSLINQTYKNIEIIVINDGSTDNSKKICEYYVDKYRDIIKLFNIKNCGVSNARNVGINKASGKYVMFVDADDYLEKNAIEVLTQYLVKYHIKLIIFDKNKIINGKLEKRKDIKKQNKIIHDNELKQIITSENIIYNTVWNEIIDLEFLKRSKICFNKKYIIAEDLLFNVELFSKLDKVLIINDRLYNYRINMNSTCNVEKKEKILLRINDTICVYNLFFNYIDYWENRSTILDREHITKKMLKAVNFELEKLVLANVFSKNEKIKIIKSIFERNEIEAIRKNIVNLKGMKKQCINIYKRRVWNYYYYCLIFGKIKKMRYLLK